jgi:hypothetical protein
MMEPVSCTRLLSSLPASLVKDKAYGKSVSAISHNHCFISGYGDERHMYVVLGAPILLQIDGSFCNTCQLLIYHET